MDLTFYSQKDVTDVSEAWVVIAGGWRPLAAGEIVTSAACAETTAAPIDWLQLVKVE